MAERKTTNKYYPPDWDPSKGSVNKHNRSHPLRARARKIDEGILVVRFEMPFNIWCLNCDNHIGMGVRYNAEKSTVGNYYTSPIYKFKMKCHLCDNHFEIQTDPGKFDYVILSGARKQVRHPEADVDDPNQISIDDEEIKHKMSDAMFRLEKKTEDKIKSDAQLPELHELKQWRSRWEDSFAANQLIRSQFRQRRRRIEQAKEKDKKLLQKTSLKISLVKSSPTNTLQAKKMLNQYKMDKLNDLEASKKKEILNSALVPHGFEKKKMGSSTVDSSSESLPGVILGSGLRSKIKRYLR